MLSFVIPVYNAAPYLEQCVAGALAFPVGQKEIILIDDGSTDGSAALCDAMAAAHPEIIVCHQPNRGVSEARNRGMALAGGEWLWFVDADDRVLAPTSALPDLATSALLLTGFVWEEGGEAKPQGASPLEVPYNLWRCWFRRRLIVEHGLAFTPGRCYAEDQEFILRYMLHLPRTANRIVWSEPLYHYTLRPGSAMTRRGTKWKQCRDIRAVLCGFVAEAWAEGRWREAWVWHEAKRLTKTLWVTATR